MALVRTTAPLAAASAGGSVPSPPASVVKTGAGRAGPDDGSAAGGGGMSDAAASVSERWPCAAFASGASVASKDRSSHRPAYTPPSSGSTSRSTTSAPSRAAYPAADRDVLAGLLLRQAEILLRARQAAGRQDSARGKVIQVGRHAHELPPWQRPDRPAGPDPGRRRAGYLQLPVQAELADQASAFRAARQQRLRAVVHRDTRDLGYRELAAEPRRALPARSRPARHPGAGTRPPGRRYRRRRSPPSASGD